MGNVRVLHRNELDEEPAYSGSQDEVGSSTSACPYSAQDPVQRIVEAYFTDPDGTRIQDVTKEREVRLVITSENMSGEDLVIDLPPGTPTMQVGGQLVEDEQIMILSVGSDTEEVVLEPQVIPKDVTVDDPDPEMPKVVSVEFLNGSDKDVATANMEQFVNLPRNEKWVDGEKVKNMDRLTDLPRILVKFDKPGRHSFTAKLVPGTNNLTYSEDEKKRNPHFAHEERTLSYITSGDGTLIISNLKLSSGGNDTFKVSVIDKKGKEVQSTVGLTTKRLFYLVELKMKGLTSITPNLNGAINEYAKHGVELLMLPAAEMEHMENIDDDEQAQVTAFENKCKEAFRASKAADKNPYAVAIAYTDHLAIKDAERTLELEDVAVGPKVAPVIIQIRGPEKGRTDAIKDRPLWKNIRSEEGWFVSCQFIPEGGDVANAVDISEDHCLPKSSQRSTTYFDRVEVKVDDLVAAKGTIRLKVHWVAMVVGGLTFAGNLICVCTRVRWGSLPSDLQNIVITHELGHQIGMASNAYERLPDQIATYYSSKKGHYGQHCHHGIPAGQARYDSVTDNGKHDCVMYGATKKSAFCEHCRVAVQKVDLSRGVRSI